MSAEGFTEVLILSASSHAPHVVSSQSEIEPPLTAGFGKSDCQGQLRLNQCEESKTSGGSHAVMQRLAQC